MGGLCDAITGVYRLGVIILVSLIILLVFLYNDLNIAGVLPKINSTVLSFSLVYSP